MSKLGKRRWSIPVEAKGEAKCCNPADCSHRAMTASPVSLGGPALCNAPSYRAAAALLCCIWPPVWRCNRLWGANFQDLLNNYAHTQNQKRGNSRDTIQTSHIFRRKKSIGGRHKMGWKSGLQEEHESRRLLNATSAPRNLYQFSHSRSNNSQCPDRTTDWSTSRPRHNGGGVSSHTRLSSEKRQRLWDIAD